jgi:hypothetical protein
MLTLPFLLLSSAFKELQVTTYEGAATDLSLELCKDLR